MFVCEGIIFWLKLTNGKYFNLVGERAGQFWEGCHHGIKVGFIVKYFENKNSKRQLFFKWEKKDYT